MKVYVFAYTDYGIDYEIYGVCDEVHYTPELREKVKAKKYIDVHEMVLNDVDALLREIEGAS